MAGKPAPPDEKSSLRRSFRKVTALRGNQLEKMEGDALLIAIAATGDRCAFERLFRHFAPRIKSYYLRCGARPSVADELAQEAMLTVWRKAALFDQQRACAATWIFTIARNLYVDAVRRDRRPNFDPSDPVLAGNGVVQADSKVIQAQSEAQVHALLMALPAAQREILELSFFADQPQSAIAKRLDVPIGTVKSRMRLALQRMRGRMTT